MSNENKSMTTGLPSSDLFGQLQLLMAAASSEVANIDDMKVKVKEAELFRERIPQLENEVAAAKEMNYGLRRSMGDLERQNAQLRHDMQSLNDIYHTEHREYINMQQARQNSDNEVLRLKHELAFAKSQINNFGELRSSNDSLMSEAVSIRKEMEALKAANTSLLTKKQTLVEVQKREREMLVKQLSNSEEEAQRLRTAAEECVFNEEAMKVRLRMAETQHLQGMDRSLMTWEDKASSEQRIHLAALQNARENTILRRDIALLRTEVQHMQDSSVDAETQFIAASAGLKEVIAKHEQEMSSIQLKLVEMKETNGTLKAQNQELDQEVSSLRMKHFAVVVEARTSTAERDQLAIDVTRLEADKKELENVVSNVKRTAELQMDELMIHMRNMSAQNETLQSQLNDSQSKYWEEMKSFKETESSLQNQIETLTRKSYDLEKSLTSLQADKDAIDAIKREEASVTAVEIQELKCLVEKHLHKITKLGSDKVAMAEEKTALGKKMEQLDASCKNTLHSMKMAFEGERSKLEDEIKKRSSKLKSVDAQRQELLKETHDLGIKLAASQGEVSKLSGELASINEQSKTDALQIEELQSRNSDLTDEIKLESAKVSAVQATMNSLRLSLQEKESQLLFIQSDAGKVHEEKSHAQLRISELSEINEVLKAQNRDMDYELMNMRNTYEGTRSELQRLTSERDQLTIAMARVEGEKTTMETKFSRDTAAMEAQRDDLQTRLQNAHNQCDATLAQLREMQNKHWEDTKAVKDGEAMLLSEADSLAQELQEKTAQLTAIKTEAIQLEQTSKEEIGRLSHMASLMADELEKRVNELTEVTAERNSLVNERHGEKKRIEELEALVKRLESTVKSTIETDRAKLQEEMRKRAVKMRALETDKQSLLQETQEFSTQLGLAQRDIATLQQQLTGASETVSEHQRQNESMRLRNTELIEELKTVSRREQEVRLELTRSEERCRGEEAKSEFALKEVKKSAASQIMDLTNQMRTMNEDNERLKIQIVDLVAADKRAQVEVDRARKDVEVVMVSREELQQQSSQELSSLRRELQDQRVRVKHLSEAKAVMEVDMVNSRMQLQKCEEELSRMRDRSDMLGMKLSNMVGDSEASKQAARDEARAAKHKTEELQSKVTYLEDMLSKQRIEMERVMHDYSRANQDGFNDNLRLKSQVEAYDSELAELRPMLPLLRKENAEIKHRFEKLQASSGSTVNSLLEELKIAEGALSSERKRTQLEAESYRMQLMEMQTAMERAKDNIEESVSRAKNERHDKDKRIQQLENEVERLKVVSMSKDGRVEDLEKQHQDDRARLLTMNINMEAAERNAAEALAALEQKKAHVDNLEKKLSSIGNAGMPSELQQMRSYASQRLSNNINAASAAYNIDNMGDDYHQQQKNSNSLYHSASAGGPSAGTSIRGIQGMTKQQSSSLTSDHNNDAPWNDDVHYDVNDDDVAMLSPLPIPAHAHVPTGPGGHPPLSPAQDNHLSGGFQSPIDRVAAALAARALKDRDNGTISGSHSGGRNGARRYEETNVDGNDGNDDNNEEDNEMVGLGASLAAEHTIQRTESYIKQRLRAAGAGNAYDLDDDGPSNNSTNSRSGGKQRK